MARFTPTQGRYLAFIHAYTGLHGYPPAESEIGAAMCVSPPSVNQMVKSLEKKGLVLRHPGRPRSLQVLVPDDEIPPWGNRKPRGSPTRPRDLQGCTSEPPSPPANLYVFSTYLRSGPLGNEFAGKVIRRDIEIRGDQSLEDLHLAIFNAYDRREQHRYEFQFGKRPYDPAGPNYGVPDPKKMKNEVGDARTTKLDALALSTGRVFGYWFNLGDEWYHQVQVERIEQAIRTVTYPRVIKRVGKSPPQRRSE